MEVNIERPHSLFEIWDQATGYDPALHASPQQLRALARRELRPVRYKRELMFSHLAKGLPLLTQGLEVPVEDEGRVGKRDAVVQSLHKNFPDSERVRTHCGPSAALKCISMSDLLRRWSSHRSKVNVTDLHIRETGVFQDIDCRNLSDFNLLPTAADSIAAQEMLSMVISSAGSKSDSHTDDPDGSNHCFAGRKLWLAWDTFLGQRQGLGDVSRFETNENAHFDISAFLAVPGSQWWVVEASQTLFLPGHLTHRVITLEDYLGVGSFFVMLPSYVRTLARWTRHTPLWALELPEAQRMDLVDEITSMVTSKVRSLASASRRERQHWGLPHLLAAIDTWHRTASGREKRELLANPVSEQFIHCAAELAAA